MTIGQSIKIAINSAFVNTTFRGRDAITIRNTLNTKVYGSNNMLVMIPVPDVKVEKLKNEMLESATKLNILRNKYAKVLEEKINTELADLEMKNARININVIFNEEDFNSNGLDIVEILIKTNIGEDAKPLCKIASGGEMSRIMLAIKNVLSNVDNVPVLIFDEIDTGISGMAAKSVGEKLKLISKMHQVLCVTHLASIAAKGDYNYFIYKNI